MATSFPGSKPAPSMPAITASSAASSLGRLGAKPPSSPTAVERLRLASTFLSPWNTSTPVRMPSRRGAMTSLTFFTASSTPFPPKRFWSPSRSSTASCSPVEAPLGTAARPAAPLDSVTSASMVGLPRLSRISRACTERIVLMMARTLAVGAVRVNARLEPNHRRAHAVAQLLASLERQLGRGDRFADLDADRAGPQEKPSLGHDGERVVHVDGHDGDPRRDRQPERRVLEWQQLAAAAARALREHHGRDAAADHRCRPLVRLDRAGWVRPVDHDVPGGDHGAAQQWN